MARKPVLFIDDGGVLNDNRVRGPRWARELGPWMAERYGGAPEDWTAANREAFPEAWEEVGAKRGTYETQREFQRDYSVSWCRAMFTRLGMPLPGPDQAEQIVAASSIHVHRLVRADISGAIDAIRALHAAGYAIHGASGTPEPELDAILATMGVRNCFGTLYGPDIVDVPKYCARYYRSIFAHAGVEPADAVVLESDADACEWARETGARAIEVAETGETRTLAAFVEELLASERPDIAPGANRRSRPI
jgi:phosphoglycolate phosphatase-like HAD superfamily hydrolase